MLEKLRQGWFCTDGFGNKTDLNIGAGGNATDGTDYVSAILNCQDVPVVGVMITATGVTGASGTVTFSFLTAVQEGVFEDVSNVYDISLTLSGTNKIKKVVKLDTSFIKTLKLYKIANGDATYGISAVNCYYYGETKI